MIFFARESQHCEGEEEGLRQLVLLAARSGGSFYLMVPAVLIPTMQFSAPV